MRLRRSIIWAAPDDAMPAPMQAALLAGDQFTRLYSNGARQGTVRAIDLHVEAVPRRMQVELEARPAGFKQYRSTPGDTVQVEATLRPWQQPARNVRIPITLPARLDDGQSAPACLGCRYAGPGAEPATFSRPPARSRLGAGAIPGASTPRTAFM